MPRVCSISDCSRETAAKGLCDPHYRRQKKGQLLDTPLRPHGVKGCSIRGCKYPHAALGLCHFHWKQSKNPPRFRQRTPKEVAAIRQLRADGATFTAIAKKFRCSASTVKRICDGESFPA